MVMKNYFQELNVPSLPPFLFHLFLSLSLSLPSLTHRTQFTLKELQKRPLPEGVDPSKLETYISDNEFEVTLLQFNPLLGSVVIVKCLG